MIDDTICFVRKPWVMKDHLEARMPPEAKAVERVPGTGN
jgi:hypothetical protein